jgi:hypothetical protein
MATAPLNKLFLASFVDGHEIKQPEDDHYSKHDDTADWNPSAFRDVLDYKESPIATFYLLDDPSSFWVNLLDGTFCADGHKFSLETVPLTDRKLIYYRETQRDIIGGEWQDAIVKRYAIGYEGKNPDGKVEKKVIFING